MRRSLFTLAFIVTLCTIPAAAVANPFTDIATSSALASPVLWAYDEGITDGTSDTTFSPDDICNRGQVVTFLWRASGEPSPSNAENPFSDVTTTDYFYTAVLWAVEEGITDGTSNTTFSPTQDCTTAHVLTFLYRANGEPDKTGVGAYYDDAINWATSTGITTSVDPDSPSPRSDIVTYLYRNAGSPEIDITDTYTYTPIEVETPSELGTLSADYFSQVTLYMMVNDITSYSCIFPDTDWMTLKDEGIYDIAKDSVRTTKSTYACIGAFYEHIYYAMSTYRGDTTLTITMTDLDFAQVDESNPSTTDNSTLYQYKADFISSINQLASQLSTDGTYDPNQSQYDNALALYRWCAYNLCYDTSFAPLSYTGYGALVNGTAVCQGYVSVYTALCNTFGIQCYGVTGVAGGDDHIWNYVCLDGNWCYVDVTYGDPVPDRTDYCNETFFAISYEQISLTHVFD